MREIGKKVWNEPAVAIGLLLSLALLAVTLINGEDWDWNVILLVVGPFLAGLGIRPFVRPEAKIEEENKQAAANALKTP
jgi:hypothetical protein